MAGAVLSCFWAAILLDALPGITDGDGADPLDYVDDHLVGGAVGLPAFLLFSANGMFAELVSLCTAALLVLGCTGLWSRIPGFAWLGVMTAVSFSFLEDWGDSYAYISSGFAAGSFTDRIRVVAWGVIMLFALLALLHAAGFKLVQDMVLVVLPLVLAGWLAAILLLTPPYLDGAAYAPQMWFVVGLLLLASAFAMLGAHTSFQLRRLPRQPRTWLPADVVRAAFLDAGRRVAPLRTLLACGLLGSVLIGVAVLVGVLTTPDAGAVADLPAAVSTP